MKSKNKTNMPNTLDPEIIRDVTINILVRDLTGRMYPSVAETTQHNNIYDWVRYAVEVVGEAAPTQQDADNQTYLYDNTIIALKAEISDAMNAW